MTNKITNKIVEPTITDLYNLILVLGEGQKEMKGDIKEMKSDIIVMKSDITVIKSDIVVMKSDILGMKLNIQTLTSDLEDLSLMVGKHFNKVYEKLDELVDIIVGVENKQETDNNYVVKLITDIQEQINRLTTQTRSNAGFSVEIDDINRKLKTYSIRFAKVKPLQKARTSKV